MTPDRMRDREVLIGRIAAELDKPSVYMGGPSKRSLRLAEAVVRITDDHYRGAVAAARADQREATIRHAAEWLSTLNRDDLARALTRELGGQ
jgi:hypothetical protein